MMDRRLNKSEAEKADLVRRIDDLSRSLDRWRERARIISSRAVRCTQFRDESLLCLYLTPSSNPLRAGRPHM